MSNKIKNVLAKEILTSGGTPTVEVKVELENGNIGKASVPYGVSAGIHEAYTLLDKDPKRYNGKGVLKACNNINTIIADKIVGFDVIKQQKIDKTLIDLDGTPNKEKLGGNSILAVSLACARVGANSKGQELFQYIREIYKLPFKKYILPKPMMVVMEGGKHADDSTDFQEYLYSVSGAPSIREAVRWGEETYQALKKILKVRGLNTNVGNEGAFAPPGIESNEKPLEMMVEAIKKAGYKPGKDIMISLDPATSEVYDNKQKKYILSQEGTGLSSDQMIGLFNDWISKYPILSIEDGLAEDEWDGWQKFYQQAGNKIKIIGDDLTVTNKERVQKAIELKAINAVLIKLNQIESLTETIETIMLGNKNGFWNVVSHRGGGETNDSFLIDLAVAVNAEYVKVGPSRGERISKYNRLMEIEDIIKK